MTKYECSCVSIFCDFLADFHNCACVSFQIDTAVKMLRSEALAMPGTFLDFIKEVDAMIGVHHPNLIQLYGVRWVSVVYTGKRKVKYEHSQYLATGCMPISQISQSVCSW